MEDFDLQSVLAQIIGDDNGTSMVGGVAGADAPGLGGKPSAAPGDAVPRDPDDAVPVVTAPPDTNVVTAPEEEPAAPPSTLVSFPKFTEEDIAETFDIRNYATLCKLKVRKWGGRVKDKSAARRTEVDAGAVNGAFSTYKKLFAGVGG
jgi:hypothetical protein